MRHFLTSPKDPVMMMMILVPRRDRLVTKSGTTMASDRPKESMRQHRGVYWPVCGRHPERLFVHWRPSQENLAITLFILCFGYGLTQTMLIASGDVTVLNGFMVCCVIALLQCTQAVTMTRQPVPLTMLGRAEFQARAYGRLARLTS
jgi:hypothetical protein